MRTSALGLQLLFDQSCICLFVCRALQEAQETFGVDFDYDEFAKYDDDDYAEEEDEEDDYVDEDAEDGERE